MYIYIYTHTLESACALSAHLILLLACLPFTSKPSVCYAKLRLASASQREPSFYEYK